MARQLSVALRSEFAVRGSPEILPEDAPYDPHRVCHHTPAQAWTREPCSCGRPLWPPRGRGRGESALSRRRLEATLRAIEAMRLSIQGYTYAQIAAQLGYATRGGAWRAIQRMRDQEAAWRNYYDRHGRGDWYRREQAMGRLQNAYASGGDAEVDRELERLGRMERRYP